MRKLETKRVAIVRLTALGDIVNTSIIIQIIKKYAPQTQIEWICEEVFAPLLKYHPDLHAVHSVNLKKLKKEFSFAELKAQVAKLKSLQEYDIIIDTQGLLKSAIIARIIGNNIHGFDKSSAREGIATLLYNTTSHIAYEESVIIRNVKLCCEALKIPYDDNDIKNKKKCLPSYAQKSCFVDSEYIVFVIGASWPSKIYPAIKFAQVANKLKKSVYLVWGSDEELKMAQEIQKYSSYVKISEKLSLLELVSLIENSSLVIGNDTGPTHMAWAQNVPSITLFGPTTARMMYETKINIALKSPSSVDLSKINKEDFSIQEIEVDDIIQTAKRVLES